MEEFESGIVPRERRTWDWLQRMKVGQSRWVNDKRRYRVSWSMDYWSKKTGFAFASRKEGDGFRIFRVK
jgi:hypothetical protein